MILGQANISQHDIKKFDKFDFNKTKNIKVKRQFTAWKKIFTIQSDKVLISKIYKRQN